MFYQNIDPVLVTIGPLRIYYYGVIFVLGIAITYFMFRRLARERGLPLSARDFDDYIIYSVIGVVAGARIGSILSELPHYLSSPLRIFAFWEGGMAFHGGLVGLLIAGLIYCRKKKISFYDVADLTVIPAALALGFGRIANFVNGEFYGTITTLPWGVKFPAADGFRHPVQLYEALKNFFMFEVLWLIKGKSLPKGFLFWLFITMYGALRFFLEFYKDLPPLLFNLTWGQVWSLPMLLAGAYFLHKLRTRKVTQAR